MWPQKWTGGGPLRSPVYCHNVITQAQKKQNKNTKSTQNTKTQKHKDTKPNKPKNNQHMPVGWPLHIDGVVRQRCIHRDTTLRELDDLLREYDMKWDLAEINRKAVWNKWCMEPKTGFTLSQMWTNSEADIAQKTSRTVKWERDCDLLGRTTSWNPKSQCVYGPENEIAAVTFLRKMTQL